MPWKECSAVSCREEFVGLAQAEWAKMSELCRRFGVSRKTGYKWLGRYASAGLSGLLDRSKRPRGSPGRTSEAMEGRVLVDRRNFHLFQPLLYQVATGGLAPANIASPLRGILKR